MNIRQEGMGLCKKCNTPIMQTINQPGVAGICFACMADGQPKTGRTVVVTKEDGDVKLGAGPLAGKVELLEVDHTVAEGSKTPMVVVKKPAGEVVQYVAPQNLPQGITLHVTIDELHETDILKTILQKIYDGIDNAPPAPTLREQKRAIKLQERLEVLIKNMEKK